ncbi:MAG: phage scaffolding protein [Lachnospiraceae bacterium]|nr:phage scaffolding protein [Lachnospiraceae bacterium]
MKNIETILKEAGLEVSEEQLKKVNDLVKENYKTVNDWQKQVDKAESLQNSLDETKKSLDTATESLKKLEGVDAEALNKQIADLTKQIKDNEDAYNSKIAERDFNDLVSKSISEAKGKNAKAIMALLDMEGLKASKNQKEDIDKALKDLSEKEDSKMLFGESEPLGTIGAIGTITSGKGGDAFEAAIRSAAGLTEKETKENA